MATQETPFEMAGKEEGIRKLVNTFYDIMDSDPEASGIRAMHGEDLSSIKDKLGDYLIGWMGGPPLYSDKYGSVCMTGPHEPFAIGPDERDQWLMCMHKALDQVGTSEVLKKILEAPMFNVADMVRNKE